MKKFSKKGRVILLTSLTIFVLFTTCIASFAWFMTVSPTTPLETISGSMDISIKKVSAYRYVYPYFNSSDTYIDYTQKGKVKEVVMKDSQIEEMGNLPSPTHPKNDQNYYLIGNSTFLGDGTKEYSLDTGLTFFSKLDNSYQISDVIISAGSIFGVSGGKGNLILKQESDVTGMEEFTFKDGFLQAKTAGRYSLILTIDDGGSAKLKIEKTTRTDDAILSMTLFDPTYAKLYSPNVATAIKDQNTLLVYDVTLDVKNEDHDFLLSCDVKRSTSSALEYPISNYLSYQIEKADGSPKFSNDIYNYFHRKGSDDSSLKTFDESTSSLNILSEEIESTSHTTSCHYYIAIDYVAGKLDEFMKESNLGRSFDLKRDYTFYFSSSQIIHEKGSQSNEKE